MMMVGQSASISSRARHRGTLSQLLVLLLLLVTLRTGAEGGRVRQPTTGVQPEAGTGASSEELLDDGSESFEQDVVNGSEKATTEDGGRETTVDPTTTEPAVTETTLGYNAVATTPKIAPTVKPLSRYEQGLEDYDEAADRAEREEQQKKQPVGAVSEQEQEQQYNNMLKPMLTLFNVISTVLSSGRSMRSAGGNKPAQLGNVTVDAGNSTSGRDNENETATAVTGGRYIKGDPLNGYYDFVISEGSYKFWVVFQLFTAGLVLYATFAALYYSKVSPLTSDYDYIDYLNGGRSFAGARSMLSDRSGGTAAPGTSVWDTVANSRWFGPAAQAFEIVMSAIENAPQ